MTTLPLFGNQNFTGISSLASQLQTANITNLTTQSLSNQLINSNFIWINSGGISKKLYSVTGNSSNSFDTLTVGTAQFLNTSPDKPASITVSGGLLVIPPGATIIAAYALDKGLFGTDSLDIGTGTITNSAPITSNNIFNAADRIDVRAGVYVSSQPVYNANSTLGGPGIIATGSSTISVPTTGSTGITVTPNTTDITSSTGLTVTIYYYV